MCHYFYRRVSITPELSKCGAIIVGISKWDYKLSIVMVQRKVIKIVFCDTACDVEPSEGGLGGNGGPSDGTLTILSS